MYQCLFLLTVSNCGFLPQEPTPAFKTVTEAWKFQSVHPTNYSLTYKQYNITLNPNSVASKQIFDEINNEAYEANFDTITSTLKKNGVFNMAKTDSIVPSRVDLAVKSKKVKMTVYSEVSDKQPTAYFIKDDGRFIYLNEFNKSIDVDSRPGGIQIRTLGNFFFVPSGFDEIGKIERKDAINSRIIVDAATKNGSARIELDKTNYIARLYRGVSAANSSERYVVQKGTLTSEGYSIPAAVVDLKIYPRETTIEVYVFSDFKSGNVTDQDFDIKYQPKWLVKDISADGKVSLHRYVNGFASVADHVTRGEPLPDDQTATFSYLYGLLIIGLVIVIVFSAIWYRHVRSSSTGVQS